MTTTDFTTTLLVNQTPQEVFAAINRVNEWWSEEIEGGTQNMNDVFTYHYKDVHICKMKLVEVIPDKKVTWLVVDNYFNFTKDKTEWRDTKIVFDISRKDNQTEIRFTHLGLVPEYECYNICENAWTNYIQDSLHSLITTGKGKPNPKENSTVKMEGKDYHTNITIHAQVHEVFKNINDIPKWWTEDVKGNFQQLNDEFTVYFVDIHVSTQKLVEVVPDKKIVWLVTDSNLNFIQNKQEWTGTKIIFELVKLGDQFTRINFTHTGLVPEIECYDACSNAWGQYIQDSLFSLIATGKGKPTRKEN